MAPSLFACASCGRYAKSTATVCPECGEALRRADGSIPRTTAAVLLGLATTAAACGGSVDSTSGGTTSGGGNGGDQTTTSTVMTHYAGPASVGSGGSTSTSVPFYGPAPSSGTTGGGQGGAGGVGGAGGQGGK